MPPHLFLECRSPASAAVTEHELHTAFSRYGELVYTKIPQGKVSGGRPGEREEETGGMEAFLLSC